MKANSRFIELHKQVQMEKLFTPKHYTNWFQIVNMSYKTFIKIFEFGRFYCFRLVIKLRCWHSYQSALDEITSAAWINKSLFCHDVTKDVFETLLLGPDNFPLNLISVIVLYNKYQRNVANKVVWSFKQRLNLWKSCIRMHKWYIIITTRLHHRSYSKNSYPIGFWRPLIAFSIVIAIIYLFDLLFGMASNRIWAAQKK